jgi:hypothetical protein
MTSKEAAPTIEEKTTIEHVEEKKKIKLPTTEEQEALDHFDWYLIQGGFDSITRKNKLSQYYQLMTEQNHQGPFSFWGIYPYIKVA